MNTNENLAGGKPSLVELEKLALDYSRHREERRAFILDVEDELNRIMRPRLKKFRALTEAEGAKKAALLKAVSEAPFLFQKPKSVTLHDIKFGFRKGSGGMIWNDEQDVLKRIHKMFPDDAADTYLHKIESPNKEALETLPVVDLKKLGIEIEATGNVPFVKPMQSDLEKFATVIVENATKDEAVEK